MDVRLRQSWPAISTLNRRPGADGYRSTKYLWLQSVENLTDEAVERFGDLRASSPKTARAWAIKENLRILSDFERQSWAEKFFRRWFLWATHSRLPTFPDSFNDFRLIAQRNSFPAAGRLRRSKGDRFPERICCSC